MINRSRSSQVIVTINRGLPNEQQYTFRDSFNIGRDESCEVRLTDALVSAFHVSVFNDKGSWWIHDAHSTNGTFCDGELIRKLELTERRTLQIGQRGPLVSVRLKNTHSSKPLVAGTLAGTLLGTLARAIPSSTHLIRNYFSEKLPQNAGQYTLNLHRAIKQTLRKRSRKFLLTLSVVSIIAAGALTMVWFQQQRLAELEPLGTDIFYSMKSLELQIAHLTRRLATTDEPASVKALSEMRERHKELQSQYDKFVEKLGIYEDELDEEGRTILRIARIFGECEINAPPDFVDEVKRYIAKWRSTSRLEEAVRRSLAYSYQKTIADEFLNHNLPPQFLYLALQESGFNSLVCGPKTRYGIAKGMWQFIPRTARAYGLKVGPLMGVRRPDPRDERHDFEKSTRAAAQLIRDLYETRAQGSGLLVLASYNWGIGNLSRIIDRMPRNPRERNFWNLVREHRIPRETYDFVFYIIAAAVIGENPELFGFDFENLLEDIS